MRALKKTLAKKIRASLPSRQAGLPDFKKEKTVLGMWGRDQIRKLDFLGQEIVTMRMDASR